MSIATGHAKKRRLSRTPVFSDLQIRQVANGDSASIAQWATSVAKDRGIRVRPRPNHEFIKAVSRLSDGVVELDPIEDLLVELGRVGVISAFQRGLLQVHYLR